MIASLEDPTFEIVGRRDDLLFVRVFDSPKAETFSGCMRRRQEEPKEDQLLRGKTEARSRGHDSKSQERELHENLGICGISAHIAVAQIHHPWFRQ